MYINKIIAILIVVLISWSCKTQQQVEDTPQQVEAKPQKMRPPKIDFSPGPPTLIYKTKADYTNLVPVILSEDKSEISSFPHPQDIYINGELALPTQLAEGYLLDNRGITANVAFLNMTYETYSKLDSVPSVDSLYSIILDKNPLTDLYNCGNRSSYESIVSDMNSMISKKQLFFCRKQYWK